MIVELIIVLVGLILSRVLFNRFPQIKGSLAISSLLKISVIIPARNEENNLSLLLKDLKKQTALIYETICVDDGSADNTVKIASSYSTRVISLQDKPEDWTGKTWACQNGADAARGDLFLFLDADVRLSVSGIGKLLYAYEEHGSVISVQPYHQTEKEYEYFSLFFNLIQYAANGLGLPKKKNDGLYGPVILISRSDYYAIDGHRSVKNSVVEDIDLGERLKKSKIDFHLFLGNSNIAYRMYGDGFKSLLQGWIKNMAAGMAKINIGILLMSFLWITSCISVPLHLIVFLVQRNVLWLIIYSLLYIVWVIELFRVSRHIGSFAKPILILYPIFLLCFLCLFVISFVKRIFRFKVVWKGRKIEQRN